MTFAKAIGGGVPLAGYIARDEIGSAMKVGDHFTTFGVNNQVGVAAGHAVLDVLENEALPDRSARLGEHFLDGLKRLMGDFDVIGDVRGYGLMLGVEFVKDRQSKEPYPEITKAIQKELMANGILVSITGVLGNVLRITPPLVITQDQIDHSLAVLNKALVKVTSD